MDTLIGDVPFLVFRPVANEKAGEYSLDGRTLRVLLEFDGKRTVAEVAKRLNVSVGQLRPIISKLLEARLLEPSTEGLPKVDQEFFSYMSTQLALAVGPLASVIIEDAVEALGFKIGDFPVSYLAELIDTVSREIPREDKRNLFKKNMLNKMKEKGY